MVSWYILLGLLTLSFAFNIATILVIFDLKERILPPSPIDTRPDFHESANFDPPRRRGITVYRIEENGDLVPVRDD